MKEACSSHPLGFRKSGGWSQVSPCGIYGKRVASRFSKVRYDPRRKWSWTYGSRLSTAYEGNWMRFATTPTTWSLPICAFGRNGGTRPWWCKVEMTRGGTTSPHTGCFLLTCHPLFGVGPKGRLVLGNIEGHRLRYSYLLTLSS